MHDHDLNEPYDWQNLTPPLFEQAVRAASVLLSQGLSPVAADLRLRQEGYEPETAAAFVREASITRKGDVRVVGMEWEMDSGGALLARDDAGRDRISERRQLKAQSMRRAEPPSPELEMIDPAANARLLARQSSGGNMALWLPLILVSPFLFIIVGFIVSVICWLFS